MVTEMFFSVCSQAARISSGSSTASTSSLCDTESRATRVTATGAIRSSGIPWLYDDASLRKEGAHVEAIWRKNQSPEVRQAHGWGRGSGRTHFGLSLPAARSCAAEDAQDCPVESLRPRIRQMVR